MKIVRITLSLVLSGALIVAVPRAATAYVLPVIDPAALAQMVQEMEKFIQMIQVLNAQYDKMTEQYDMLKEYAELDHEGLAYTNKFLPFFEQYKAQFQAILDQIGSYQNGGLLSNVSRLDEVYSAYHEDWENQDKPGDFTYEADPKTRELKKQLLWSKIQLKHAAMVGAKIRDAIPTSQEHVNTFLNDTHEAKGMLLTAQIGNELLGEVAKSINTLSVQMNEVMSAQVAQGLEQNQRAGRDMNRMREAISDWGTETAQEAPAPLNPFGAY